MSIKPRAGIIVPSRGGEEGLRRLFDALLPELAGQEVEVLLADDGSEKPLQFFEKEYQGRLNLKVVRQDPLGPAAARNTGIKNSSSDILIFLDSDVTPLPGWFEAIITPLERNPELAAVEGKTIASNLDSLDPFLHFVHNFDGGQYLTCNMAYRRSRVEAAQGFDERFKHPYREDSDLAFSVLEQGGRIVFEPAAVVDHPVRPVRLWRMFWLYPVRRGYNWLLFRRHPQMFREKVDPFTDKSELSFILSFALAAAFFVLGWPWPGFAALILHQAIYSHLLLRHLYFGGRKVNNLATPWKIFAKAYPFFWPATFLSMAGIAWGWFRFLNVRPANPEKP